MAVGTRAGLLDEEPLQSFMKHQVLRRYMTVFTHKLSRGRGRLPVVLVDGYAGRGRYKDGSPASGELLLQAAASAPVGSAFVELVEPEAEHRAVLETVVAEYQAPWARVSAGTVESNLSSILDRSRGKHLFLFLDPCGAGLAFEQVVALYGRCAAVWPRTEILLNFNANLGRRVAANALKRETDSVLDHVCGPWWRDVVNHARGAGDQSWEGPLQALVSAYLSHLVRALPGASALAVPVRKKYTNQPIFYLVHIAKQGIGTWAMSDAVARATRDWRKEHDIRENHGQDALFDSMETVESFADAEAEVRANLLLIAAGGGTSGRLAEDPRVLSPGVIGAMTETDIARVARQLEKEGRLRLDRSLGNKPDQLRIYPVA